LTRCKNRRRHPCAARTQHQTEACSGHRHHAWLSPARRRCSSM
jgi:hypothetical protein